MTIGLRVSFLFLGVPVGVAAVDNLLGPLYQILQLVIGGVLGVRGVRG